MDLDVSVDKGLQKLIDTAGAGMSVTSPDWLTQLGRLWGGRSVSRGTDHCTSEPEDIARAAECSSLHMSSIQNPPFALQDVPVADAKAEDIQELLGGALFKALYKWMIESGPVYLLPTGEMPLLCCIFMLEYLPYC